MAEISNVQRGDAAPSGIATSSTPFSFADTFTGLLKQDDPMRCVTHDNYGQCIPAYSSVGQCYLVFGDLEYCKQHS